MATDDGTDLQVTDLAEDSGREDSGLEADGVRSQRIPGEPGLWVFLFGDMIIFAIMFVVFLSDRAKEPEVFSASRDSLDITIALVNTMVLLVSSLLVVIGLESARRGVFGRAATMFAGAIGCAVLFTALKATEYIHLVDAGHGPDVNAYFMWLFILTGIHLSHVVIGIGVLAVLMRRARRRIAPTGSDRLFYEGGACYWHLVDLLWMILFPLIYLVA